jgi:hypothetical protein
VEKFAAEKWTIIVNIVSGIADVGGKIFGFKIFKGFMNTLSLPLMLTCCGFTIYLYLSHSVIFRFVSYLVLVACFFGYFRTSATVLFYILKGNKKSTPKN